jgi:lipoprotein-releasing system ATP-binding protein
MSDALRLESVARKYAQGDIVLDVFENVSFKLKPGEIVALVGPSGAGKSSLLHMAGLLEAPSGGEVFIGASAASKLPDSERTRIRRETMGFVYQAHHLLPEFSALENVMLPQLIAGKRREAAKAEATRLLMQLGLGERLTHRPAQLSGGEQQRVAIARALANHPQVLLADEPTGNLDPHTAGEVFDALVKLVRSEGLAALIATHNLQLAAKMDRALVLDNGRLADSGGARAV